VSSHRPIAVCFERRCPSARGRSLRRRSAICPGSFELLGLIDSVIRHTSCPWSVNYPSRKDVIEQRGAGFYDFVALILEACRPARRPSTGTITNALLYKYTARNTDIHSCHRSCYAKDDTAIAPRNACG
jgi:hypothetical protein